MKKGQPRSYAITARTAFEAWYARIISVARCVRENQDAAGFEIGR
jgi:hypothetical protein